MKVSDRLFSGDALKDDVLSPAPPVQTLWLLPCGGHTVPCALKPTLQKDAGGPPRPFYLHSPDMCQAPVTGLVQRQGKTEG